MTTQDTSGQTQIIIDGSLLIHGKYSVQGQDLVISTELDSVVLKDYFEHLPILVSPQGSKLTPHLVSLLSAYQPNDYLGFEDPQAIGEITLTGGPITVTRAGQQIELNVGDFIYLNDLVEVGEYNVGITFKDDTALSLESGARMIIDDFVYDPDTPTEGSMNANVLGGGFSFVSGNVAKVGADAMTVTTPVLTIGVRGTQVAGRANQDGEDNEIILLPNEDGTVGQIMVSNDSGSVLLTEAFQGTTITSAVEAPSIPVIIPEDIVLKKFAKTIATNKTTLKTSKKNKQSKEAEKEKQKLEKEKEELEQEKEQLEEEKEQLEEEAEAIEEEKEQLEEELEEVAEKEKEVELKEEALEEAKIELEEKLEQAPPQEKAKIEEELAKVEEEIVEVEEIREEIVEEKIQFEEKIQEVEEVVQKIEQKFAEVEQKFEAVVVQEQAIEQNFQKIEQEIQKIEQEFEQFFQELEQDFGAEVVNEVAEVFEQANEVHEEKIVQQVEEEIVEEIKMEEKIEDPFEEAPQEEMEKEMEQKMEEEIQLLNEEPPVEEMPVEEDLFEEKMEEEVKQIEEEFAPENFEEEPMLVEDNVFADEQKDEPKIEEEKIEEVKVEDFNQPMMNEEVFQEEFVAFFEPDANNENEEANDFNFVPIINLDNFAEDDVQDDIEVIEAVEANPVVLNSAPTIDSISNVSKSESLSVGSTIATASASDADGDSLTYSLTVDQSGKLSIDQNGAITLASAFDNVASDTNYNVTVRATDGTDDAKADFVLTVTADGSITIHENVLDFEDVHSSNDGTEIAYKLDIGYYTMNLGQGDTTNQARIVRQSGHNYHSLTNVQSSDLQGKDIVYVHNGSNSTWGAEWRSGTGQAGDSAASDPNSAIWSWVDDGGILLIQDRHVTNANAMLLGESATITRSVLNGTNDDTDFRTELNDTLLYNGAAGTLTNLTMDGGNHTDHGHITNLGTGEVGIGHRGSGNPTPNGDSYYNAIAYKYGSGLVYYDTYPMDLWDGYGVSDTYTSTSTLLNGGAQVYNENLIQWAASLYYDGASQINGTSGAETILGTMGDDVIFGDYGADTLWGGDGADTFVYTNTNQGDPSYYDHIQDFDKDEDSIDISAITSGASVARTMSGTRLQLDTDNNGTYEMEFNLVGYTGTADDVTVVT